jgi:hypothetical protein
MINAGRKSSTGEITASLLSLSDFRLANLGQRFYLVADISAPPFILVIVLMMS